jgi:glyoxylase-like metal-dependent hydrolase (beta-lactamase superfamily II)
MEIDPLVVGLLQSNCYVISDEKSHDAIVVDPGDDPEKIMGIIAAKKLKVRFIVCTHAHFDHLGGVSVLKGATGAKIVLHKDDLEIYRNAEKLAASWGFEITQPPEPDMFVKEGDELSFGGLEFKVLSVPGHSPGGICLYGNGILVTGDTVFAGSVGRTDLYGGNMEDLKRSFGRIMSLPPATRILPGHGPLSTVGEEKNMNFFIYEL